MSPRAAWALGWASDSSVRWRRRPAPVRSEISFFFSSRRRHTRFKCDWSSDVCSSDLGHRQVDFIELAGEVNLAMPYHVIAATISALNRQKKAINGSKILVLGVAYKKDIDDLRESPALTIIELLQKEGAAVSYNDPYFPFVVRGRKYDLQMKCTPLDNLGQYDCVLIVTDHSYYDYKKIVNEAQLVVDSRNATRGIKRDNIG